MNPMFPVLDALLLSNEGGNQVKLLFMHMLWFCTLTRQTDNALSEGPPLTGAHFLLSASVSIWALRTSCEIKGHSQPLGYRRLTRWAIKPVNNKSVGDSSREGILKLIVLHTDTSQSICDDRRKQGQAGIIQVHEPKLRTHGSIFSVQVKPVKLQDALVWKPVCVRTSQRNIFFFTQHALL